MPLYVLQGLVVRNHKTVYVNIILTFPTRRISRRQPKNAGMDSCKNLLVPTIVPHKISLLKTLRCTIYYHNIITRQDKRDFTNYQNYLVARSFVPSAAPDKNTMNE